MSFWMLIGWERAQATCTTGLYLDVAGLYLARR